jgi:hypothetical protein
MLLELISTITAGFGAAGLALIAGFLLRVAGVALPRWIVPTSAGLGMLAFAIWSEYSWFGRVAAQLPPQVVVIDAPSEASLFRPWTQVWPITLRFLAIDTGGVLRSSVDPELWIVPVAVVQRWADTRRLTIAVDCAGMRSAALLEGAALGPDGSLGDVSWQDAGPDDPIVRATCAGG